MDYEMRTDADLLNDLFSEAPIVTDRVSGMHVALSRKLVASWTGMSIKTISDYGTGKYNIPIDFWRRLLEHYMDVRILALLLGNSGQYEIILHDGMPPLGSVALFKTALEQEGLHHEQMMHLANIIADGRIDELDNASVTDYHAAYMKHRMRDAQLHAAIMDRHAKSFNRKVGQL